MASHGSTALNATWSGFFYGCTTVLLLPCDIMDICLSLIYQKIPIIIILIIIIIIIQQDKGLVLLEVGLRREQWMMK